MHTPTREERIIAAARRLLPDRASPVWDKGYIDEDGAPVGLSDGERVIVACLVEAWRGTGTFGGAANLDVQTRRELAELVAS